jgi:hypothetical protein
MLRLLILLLGLTAYDASSANYPEHFRYQILVTDPTTSSVSEETFNLIPHKVLALHYETLKNEQLSISIETDWVKPYFTAWAREDGNKRFTLSFWGGLARIPGMNDEGHAFVACHELGHVIGGAPKIKIKKFLWSSAEGQSDFFASAICMKRYLRSEHQRNELTVPDDIPEVVYTLCRTTYEEEEDFLICVNTQKATKAFSHVLEHLGQYSKTLDVSSPSRDQVKEIVYNSYPEQQCRIDTIFQGSLCKEENYPCEGMIGSRPLCWYLSSSH